LLTKRSMSRRVYAILNLIAAGETLPVAWKTPPSSMILCPMRAPVRARIAGSRTCAM